MLAMQTMLRLGVSPTKIEGRLRDVRAERYQLMAGFFPGVTDADDTDQPRLASISIGDGAAAIGQSIAALALENLDVSVNALVRGGVRRTSPPAQTTIEAADLLILVGVPEALARAEMRVLQGA